VSKFHFASDSSQLICRNEDWLHYLLPVHYTSHRNIDLPVQTVSAGMVLYEQGLCVGLMVCFVNCLSAFQSRNLALFLI